MSRSQARVVTDRPARYAKQLASHLGRRIETSWDEESGKGFLTFPFGSGTMIAEEGALALAVEGADADLERLEDVVGRHLVRFGGRNELVVVWERDNGTPGTEFRNEEAEAE